MQQFATVLVNDMRTSGDLVKNLLFARNEYAARFMHVSADEGIKGLISMIRAANPVRNLGEQGYEVYGGLAVVEGEKVTFKVPPWIRKEWFEFYDSFTIYASHDDEVDDLRKSKPTISIKISKKNILSVVKIDEHYATLPEVLDLRLLDCEFMIIKETGLVQKVLAKLLFHFVDEANEKCLIALIRTLNSYTPTPRSVYHVIRIYSAMMACKSIYIELIRRRLLTSVHQITPFVPEIELLLAEAHYLESGDKTLLQKWLPEVYKQLDDEPMSSHMFISSVFVDAQDGYEKAYDSKSIVGLRDFAQSDYMTQAFRKAKNSDLFDRIRNKELVNEQDFDKALGLSIGCTVTKIITAGFMWKAPLLLALTANALAAFFLFPLDSEKLKESEIWASTLISETKRFFDRRQTIGLTFAKL